MNIQPSRASQLVALRTTYKDRFIFNRSESACFHTQLIIGGLYWSKMLAYHNLIPRGCDDTTIPVQYDQQKWQKFNDPPLVLCFVCSLSPGHNNVLKCFGIFDFLSQQRHDHKYILVSSSVNNECRRTCESGKLQSTNLQGLVSFSLSILAQTTNIHEKGRKRNLSFSAFTSWNLATYRYAFRLRCLKKTSSKNDHRIMKANRNVRKLSMTDPMQEFINTAPRKRKPESTSRQSSLLTTRISTLRI